MFDPQIEDAIVNQHGYCYYSRYGKTLAELDDRYKAFLNVEKCRQEIGEFIYDLEAIVAILKCGSHCCCFTNSLDLLHGQREFCAGTALVSTYIDYTFVNGVMTLNLEENYDVPATRAKFSEILSGALPNVALEPINQIDDNAVPDVLVSAPYGEAVYKLYRAGIMRGSDSVRTFLHFSEIKKSKVATIVSRMEW